MSTVLKKKRRKRKRRMVRMMVDYGRYKYYQSHGM